MTVIHIKKVQRPDPHSGEIQEWFAVPAMSITTPKGKKLIPNPHGQEPCLFGTLEEAEDAIRRAGFDFSYEGKTTVTLDSTSRIGTTAISQNPMRAAIPLLIDRLRDKEPAVVANAAFALGELAATEAIPDLAAILGHEDGNVRKHVAEALGKLAQAAIPELRKAYANSKNDRDKNAPYVRLTIMLAYQELAHRYAEALPSILPDALEALQDESWLVRAQAALVVGLAAQQEL